MTRGRREFENSFRIPAYCTSHLPHMKGLRPKPHRSREVEEMSSRKIPFTPPVWALVISFAAIALLLTAPAFAWEVTMKGEYEYRMRYLGRMGKNDLFGMSNVQETNALAAAGNALSIGFAGPNIYWNTTNLTVGLVGSPTPTIPADTAFGLLGARMQIVRGGYSSWGSDAMMQESRMTLRPSVKVNRAIRVHGVATIGGYRHKYVPYEQIAGTGVPLGVPPFERYYTSQTSMNAYDTAAEISVEQFRATVKIPWGILSFGVKDFPLGTGATFGHNSRSESLLLIVPYGPFRIMPEIRLARSAGRLQDPRGWQIDTDGWDTAPDGDLKNNLSGALYTTYRSGPLEVGGGVIYRLFHASSAVSGAGQPAVDLDQLDQAVYLKFSNGRVFANGEYAWRNLNFHFVGGRPTFQEQYHCFAEAGTVAGPAKLSLMFAQSSGRVLNSNNLTKVYESWPINYQAMEPYEWLMFRTYAGGNDTYDGIFVDDGHGMLGDGYAYAGRLDYAVASNLNVWGSYIWGHRLERAGSLAGQKNETGSATLQGAPFMALYGGSTAFTPDGFIGWEANAGVDWKLLEGMTFKTRWAYWQPGEWFDYAYQAVGPRGGAIVNDAILKGRDAIHAFEGTMVVVF